MSSNVIAADTTSAASPTPAITATATGSISESTAIIQPTTAAAPLPEIRAATTLLSAMPSTTEGIQPLSVPAWSIEKVKATIMQLQKQFADLACHAQREIREEEQKNQQFVDDFRNYVLLLPVAKKPRHVKFFEASEDDILAARTTQKLLAIMYRHSDYCNYEILDGIIAWFCSAPLQKSMQQYCEKLEEYEMATTVDVYISAIPPKEKNKTLEESFSKMIVKIDKPSSECRLYEIRKLNEAFIKGSQLNPHSAYISAVCSNCVVVEFLFPTSAVGWILAAFTATFMHTHLITEVTVDGERLTVVEADMDELVHSMCVVDDVLVWKGRTVKGIEVIQECVWHIHKMAS